MKRYIKASIECGDDIWFDDSPRSMTIEEAESSTFTGLYDADGNEIHKAKPRMGFMR